MTAGYSGTSLVKKLGIKDNFKVKFINAPDHYFDLLEELPGNLSVETSGTDFDFIHVFLTEKDQLEAELISSKESIKKNGMIWVSWPKKASGIFTTVDENLIRNTALTLGLVDIKVCAIDKIWSGLKVVYRVKDR